MRDFFHDIGNYVRALDTLAEDRAAWLPAKPGGPSESLTVVLEGDYGVTVVLDRDLVARRPTRHLDAGLRRPLIDVFWKPASRRFAMAHQIALLQMAEMPDGARCLSMAACVTKAAATFDAPSRRYAIGWGCELTYADQLVYADGLDWRRPQVVTPIGVSCRFCDRPDCAQRAFPPVGRRLTVNSDTRGEVPYELPRP